MRPVSGKRFDSTSFSEIEDDRWITGWTAVDHTDGEASALELIGQLGAIGVVEVGQVIEVVDVVGVELSRKLRKGRRE